jgi:hypothetical protein
LVIEKLLGAGSHGCGALPGQDISHAVSGKLAGLAPVALSARTKANGESGASRSDHAPSPYTNAAEASGGSRSYKIEAWLGAVGSSRR